MYLFIPVALANYGMPVVAAIASWICVSLIIYIIGHPKHPVKIFGIKIQGLLYVRQAQVRTLLVNNIVQQVLAKKDTIVQSAASEKNIEQLMPHIETHIQEFLTVRVPLELPMIAMFLGDKTTHQIKEVFMKELRSLFPQVLTQYFAASFDEKKLHELIAAQLSASSGTVMGIVFEKSVRPLFFRIKLYAFFIGLAAGCLLTFVLSLFA